MTARPQAKPDNAGKKTKVKNSGRQTPIIDKMGVDGNPVPMSRYQSLVTKASNTGPFRKGDRSMTVTQVIGD